MVELGGGVGEAIEDDHAVVASVIVGVHDERERVAEVASTLGEGG